MQLRIGISEAAARELVIELPPDDDATTISDRLTDAAANGAHHVWFLDRHGGRFGVPLCRISYVEIDP